jgi:hypothetical protein
MSALCQRSGLGKRGHQDQRQRDENQGAADQQQDFARHIGVHQIFRVHFVFLSGGSARLWPVPALETSLNRGLTVSRDPPQEGRPSGLVGDCRLETSIGSLISVGNTVQNGSFLGAAAKSAARAEHAWRMSIFGDCYFRSE